MRKGQYRGFESQLGQLFFLFFVAWFFKKNLEKIMWFFQNNHMIPIPKSLPWDFLEKSWNWMSSFKNHCLFCLWANLFVQPVPLVLLHHSLYYFSIIGHRVRLKCLSEENDAYSSKRMPGVEKKFSAGTRRVTLQVQQIVSFNFGLWCCHLVEG